LISEIIKSLLRIQGASDTSKSNQRECLDHTPKPGVHAVKEACGPYYQVAVILRSDPKKMLGSIILKPSFLRGNSEKDLSFLTYMYESLLR